jgi:fructose/tagatose bisphosphate aldolase
MPVITKRNEAIEIFEKAVEYNISIAIFCTANHWNTEAILLAAQKTADKYGIRGVPVVIANTFTYKHMPQAKRFLYCRDPVSGLLSHISHMEALCSSKYAPYRDVIVLPHLDHADPINDMWALTVGSQYFTSVMFDAQYYEYDKNLELTRDYVRNYGKDVLVEGIIETLNVEGASEAVHIDNYCERAKDFVEKTKIDFLVADLGTEQQSSSVGGAKYDKKRARQLTEVLQKKMLVLHGTSSLTEEQTKSLADDGVVRVNMWTRIAREAGQYAAENLVRRIDNIRKGDFEATESNCYIRDNVEKASEVMVDMMELFGYANWRG